MSQTHQINLVGAQQSAYEYTVDRINKVIDSIKFFESLPPNELLDLIKQQMEKHDITLSLLKEYHLHYVYLQQPPMSLIGPITQACQTLWEIINDLENKCKQTTI